MSLIRVLRTAQQTLTRTIYSDETLTDAGGTVTVEVRRLDGTLVTSGNATDAPGVGAYSFVLPGGPAAPASATWQLDTLVVTWTGSFGGAVVTLPPDYVEVVAGFMFGLPELRTRFSIPATVTSSALAAARLETEQECEEICGQSFTPRFARVALDGGAIDTVVLPRMKVRAVRAVTVGGASQDLAGVAWSESGVLALSSGVWPAGRRNVVVEFEYGRDLPPEFIRTAGMLRAKTLLGAPKSGVPARAAQFTLADGGVYRLAMPTRDSTGIPEVDGAYAKEPSQLRGWLS